VLLHPTYSIRDASRSLAQLFAGATAMHSYNAGSLFLETTLPYRDTPWPAHTIPDGLLTYDRRYIPGPELVPLDTYWIQIHPRYSIVSRPIVESGAAMLNVYRHVHAPQRQQAIPRAARPESAPTAATPRSAG
jgi:hypothetical protein